MPDNQTVRKDSRMSVTEGQTWCQEECQIEFENVCHTYVSRWFTRNYVRIMCQGGITRSEVMCHWLLGSKQGTCHWLQFLAKLVGFKLHDFSQTSCIMGRDFNSFIFWNLAFEARTCTSKQVRAKLAALKINVSCGWYIYIYMYNIVSRGISNSSITCILHMDTHVRKPKQVCIGSGIPSAKST